MRDVQGKELKWKTDLQEFFKKRRNTKLMIYFIVISTDSGVACFSLCTITIARQQCHFFREFLNNA